MDKASIELRCRKRANELLDQYFPNFIQEAAVDRPEQLAPVYNDELPGLVEDKFRGWLSDLWMEITPPGSKPFDEVMNLRKSMMLVDASYAPLLKEAREKAEKITLLEKITRSNHEQVTYYKGLLKQYTEELLDTMIKDFMGDIA